MDSFKNTNLHKKAIVVILTILAMISLMASGCSLVQSSNSSDLAGTIAAFEAQSTIINLQATINAQNQLANLPTSLPTANMDLVATQIAQGIQLTMDAKVASAPPVVQPSLQPVIESFASSEADFLEWSKTAKILLYEDMIGDPRVRRYVKEALIKMQLPFDDVGNAQGWLKDRMLFGSKGGEPWDLIILAVEWREQISGEFFEYAIQALDQGTSVIMKTWYLDKVTTGKIKPLLDECGLKVTNYVGTSRGALDLVLWPSRTHPVLTEPNNYLSFKKVNYYWPPSDLGDLLELTGTGDAELLIGRDIEDQMRYGVLAVCKGGQFTLQTFSSHNYYLDTMTAAWENYIYNALKVRFRGAR